MTRSIVLLLLVALVALSFAPKVAAFGAGNIPSYSHLEDRAFRHGDIEDIIEKCTFPLPSFAYGQCSRLPVVDFFLEVRNSRLLMSSECISVIGFEIIVR